MSSLQKSEHHKMGSLKNNNNNSQDALGRCGYKDPAVKLQLQYLLSEPKTKVLSGLIPIAMAVQWCKKEKERKGILFQSTRDYTTSILDLLKSPEFIKFSNTFPYWLPNDIELNPALVTQLSVSAGGTQEQQII